VLIDPPRRARRLPREQQTGIIGAILFTLTEETVLSSRPPAPLDRTTAYIDSEEAFTKFKDGSIVLPFAQKDTLLRGERGRIPDSLPREWRAKTMGSEVARWPSASTSEGIQIRYIILPEWRNAYASPVGSQLILKGIRLTNTMRPARLDRTPPSSASLRWRPAKGTSA